MTRLFFGFFLFFFRYEIYGVHILIYVTQLQKDFILFEDVDADAVALAIFSDAVLFRHNFFPVVVDLKTR